MHSAFLLLALSIGCDHKPVPPRSPYRDSAAQARILRRFADHPETFNPHFNRADPVAAHAARFQAGFPHMGREAALAAQKLGLEKDKELAVHMNRNRPPVVMQMQLQVK